MAGRSVMDPSTAKSEVYAVAHEIGHAMGLNHKSADGEQFNLMWALSNRGANLNKEQCKKIWAEQKIYPC